MTPSQLLQSQCLGSCCFGGGDAPHQGSDFPVLSLFFSAVRVGEWIWGAGGIGAGDHCQVLVVRR